MLPVSKSTLFFSLQFSDVDDGKRSSNFDDDLDLVGPRGFDQNATSVM